MKKILILLSIFVVLLIFTTYKVKYNVQQDLAYLRNLQREIGKTEEQLKLLKLDWAFLVNPDRLRRVADKYQAQLNLAPLRAEQILQLEELEQLLDGQ